MTSHKQLRQWWNRVRYGQRTFILGPGVRVFTLPVDAHIGDVIIYQIAASPDAQRITLGANLAKGIGLGTPDATRADWRADLIHDYTIDNAAAVPNYPDSPRHDPAIEYPELMQ